MNENFKKGEFNIIQIIKLSIMAIGGGIIAFGILKTAYYVEKIYWLILNK